MTCIDLHSTSGTGLLEKVVAEVAVTPTGLDEALLAALSASPSNLPDEESLLPVGPPPGLEHIAWLTYPARPLPNQQSPLDEPSELEDSESSPEDFDEETQLEQQIEALTRQLEEAESSLEVDSEEDDGDLPLPPGFEHLKHSDANDLTTDSTTDDAGTSSSDSSSEDESPGSESLKMHLNAPWRTRESKTRNNVVVAQTASMLPPWRSKTKSVAEPEVDSDAVKVQAPWRTPRATNKVSPERKSFEADDELPNLMAPPEYYEEWGSERATLLAREETVIWVSSRRDRFW